MQKLGILLIALTFVAASCNLADPLSYTSGEEGVFKSEDAGESFHPFNRLTPKGSLNNVSVNVLSLNPRDTDVVYIGSGSGLYKSEDGGNLWKYILTGIGIAEVSIDPVQPKNVYAAGISGNNGKIIKSTDAGVSWSDAYTEPSKGNAVTAVAVSPQNPSLLFGGLATGEIIRSNDSGTTWQAVYDMQDRVVKIKSAGGNVYALSARKGLFKSSDQGSSWTGMTGILTADSFLSSNGPLSISAFYDFALDPRQSAIVYAATEEGLIRTVNDGTAWTAINLPVRDRALKISALAINPANSNNIYCAIGSTIFKSVNGGVTWETNELRSEQAIRQILIDPGTTNVIYLGLGDKKK